MKYIDADRLKAEIEQRKQSLRVGICSDDAFTKEQKKEMLVASEEIDRFNRIIDSLQEKQPAVDLVAELKNHLATTPKEQLEKEWKELEPWGNIGPTVQEFLYGKQPEVDLEKGEQPKIDWESEIEEYWIATGWSKSISLGKFKVIARYFIGLALNTRNEE